MGLNFEREPYLSVVSMSAKSAKAFAMPNAAKVVCVGQADQRRYKFGAREYLLFATLADYQTYLNHRRAADQGADV